MLLHDVTMPLVYPFISDLTALMLSMIFAFQQAPDYLSYNFLRKPALNSLGGVKDTLNLVGTYLAYHPSFRNVIKILQANTPIVKFKHITGVNFDISCHDFNG